MGAKPGDLAVLLSVETMKSFACVLGDYGPELGEVSIALARAFGGSGDARTGTLSGGFVAAVFPDTTGPWPRGDEEVSSQAATRFAPWGGVERLLKAIA
jgi:hypothetical protein